ncbi:MAG: ABC transporter permease [Gammaproteobacteria bacterium]|nr:MAG: ABC transporter permease [Gammaproteobacteria bacterium]
MNIALLIKFAEQDLLDRYSSSMLGWAWLLLLPLVNIIIFTMVFSLIMGARLAQFGQEFSQYSYSIYLVPGLLSWISFSNVVIRTTNVFQEKSALINKLAINLQILPVYILLSEAIIFLVSILFFLCFLLLIGFPITVHWLLIPFIYVLQQGFAYAIGFGAATIGVFIRDVREVVSVVMQFWFWLTPIVYVVDIMPDKIQTYLAINPFTVFLNAYREVIIDHSVPTLQPLLILLVISMAIWFCGRLFFKRVERDIRDFI